MSRTGGWRRGRPPVRNRHNDRLANLDPAEFERVVAEHYRGQGYRVDHCGTGGGLRRFDGGIDLKMYRDGKYTIVQCKRENALQVTHNVGHELLGILATEKADHAIVVNAGEFTRHAIESAMKDPRLQLVDGDRLREMLPDFAVPVVVAPAAPRADSLEEVHGIGGDWSLSAPNEKPAPFTVRSLDEHERAFGSGSRRRRKANAEGIKVILVLALLAFVLWQCSREPERRVRMAPPAALPTPESTLPQARQIPVSAREQPARARVQTYSESELRKEKARAEEAMKVIEATTPEM